MLQDRISADLKEAMKARDESRVSVLRMVISAIKNKRIDALRDLTDDDVVGVIRTLVKQYRDALGDFTRGGRQDLAEKTRQEITTLETYLPAAPTEAQIRAVVAKKIKTLGAKTAADFGKVMGASTKELVGASGEVVSRVVRELLKQ